MKPIFVCLALTALLFSSCTVLPENQLTEQDYIQAWKKFYPSKALAQGMHDAIFDYEDRSAESVLAWLDFNRKMLDQLPDGIDPAGSAEGINARLLKVQIQNELHRWGEELPHITSASFYASLIDRSLDPVLEANFLTAPEKAEIICSRLQSIQNLCLNADKLLEEIKQDDVSKSLEVLEKNKIFYEEELLDKMQQTGIQPACSGFEDLLKSTASSIQRLIDVLRTEVLINQNPTDPILGREEYARQLSSYLDLSVSPEQLAELALQEIQDVRALIEQVSKTYLEKAYPNRTFSGDFEKMVRLAFDDMEKDAPVDGAEYLAFWQDLADAAMSFIKEKKIATLPEYQTLRIIPAPESAGPAARIGWVDSAPPFDPNPVTTLYLPNIPDTFPAGARKDFWSSFNKPFNRMIVIHELFPGHYMQIKISRETPHPVRLLFPYGPYFEGWASFTEEVLLDAGWEKERPLTYLAHLRKRLENANRAYTSVMVHCNDWDQEKVMEFSTETALLAPQFAKSLWGRLMRSPMQMTSYFYGGMQFRELQKAEKERLGDRFDLQLFMDTIMKTGPIPIEEFHGVFREIMPG
jgi:uncharacterized protein (DUF885 family)